VQPRELLVGEAVLGLKIVEARPCYGLELRVLDDYALAGELPARVDRKRRPTGQGQGRRATIAQPPVTVVAGPGPSATPQRRRRAQAFDRQLATEPQVQMNFSIWPFSLRMPGKSSSPTVGKPRVCTQLSAPMP